MAQIDIGDIRKLVVADNGLVAAVGAKGTFRFDWEVAHSRARVDELSDVRLNALLEYGLAFSRAGDLALIMPRGSVIPLPSEKRAKNWMKRGSGPMRGSRWPFESAVEAGFMPRYYLGESKNPYGEVGAESFCWHIESVYLPMWIENTIAYFGSLKQMDVGERAFLEKIPDWQTRVLVAAMAEDEYCNGDYMRFAQYLLTEPLLSV